MKKLELVFIIDRSGSMSGLEKETINGFNSMIEEYKKEDIQANVSTVLFDHEIKILHKQVPLKQIDSLTEKEYFVRGMTALYDAVGSTIIEISDEHQHLAEKELPDKTIFVIITDGLENASKEFVLRDIRKLIVKKKQVDDWQFLFLGANIDAVETANSIGIDEQAAANFAHDEVGIKKNFKAVAKAIQNLNCSATLSEDWKKEVEEDLKIRKKK